MEDSIAREFIPSQNKAAYIYILIDKHVKANSLNRAIHILIHIVFI